MDRFDLFAYLGKKDDEEATYYRCGYYIINKYTNKIKRSQVKDTFYTFIDNKLLRFDMMEREEWKFRPELEVNDVNYFNVYKIKTFTDKELANANCFIMNWEDVREELIPQLMNIASYDPASDEEAAKILEEAGGYAEE